MPLSQVQAIAFDLDGTLIDSGPSLAHAAAETLIDLGRPPCDPTKALGWIGNGAEVLIRRALSDDVQVDPGLDEALVAKALSRFHHHYAQHQAGPELLYPDVAQTLTTLKARGYRLGLVTNKPAQFVPELLAACGIDHLFDHWFGGDSLARRKPDPLPLNTLLQRWGLTPEQMLMVGDSRNDIEAGKAAGCPTIGLSYGYNYGLDIRTLDPDHALDQFKPLLALLPALTENEIQ
ncbi:phosphoglycolate phosphatase [Ferrimonas marina]|uniref:Phosphoglycolate phosphatase n=1 Tax=Ferrimonas marina TaxID=299255 RepID=A0A1M5XGV0_9GAMM|nr:phosphoglycolate phosphatase [Ferrimonas marina]SHH98862.1 phosphoglycolate phosphatase [Ferrimonas marina]